VPFLQYLLLIGTIQRASVTVWSSKRASNANRATRMKLVTCIVRPERLHAVKEALFQVGVTGMTLERVSGHGGEQEVVEHYRGSALVLEFRDKVKIEMAVSEPFVEATIQAILGAARTGEVGDGKIFVQQLDRVVRIRTGERDVEALTPVTADEVQARHADSWST
jgi:nitrogen regulatory protein P-II 1